MRLLSCVNHNTQESGIRFWKNTHVSKENSSAVVPVDKINTGRQQAKWGHHDFSAVWASAGLSQLHAGKSWQYRDDFFFLSFIIRLGCDRTSLAFRWARRPSDGALCWCAETALYKRVAMSRHAHTHTHTRSQRQRSVRSFQKERAAFWEGATQRSAALSYEFPLPREVFWHSRRTVSPQFKGCFRGGETVSKGH